MAVSQTGAIYKALTIDGQSSRDYGVYITGEAVYNAPEREVEMVTIPGRSGQLALDKGRFENIEVTYPAGIFADNEADFAEAISEFRNFLCSRGGYVRIQDEYNPNEYRMGVYKSGLEVTPALLKAGQFDIVFDCKPQRWLTDGETAVTVEDGDVLTNPTLFESSPLLEAEGYGTIGFNGYEIELFDETLGIVELEPSGSAGGGADYQWTKRILFDSALFNNGDIINIESISSLVHPDNTITITSVTSVTNSQTNFSATYSGNPSTTNPVKVLGNNIQFSAGQGRYFVNETKINYKISGSSSSFVNEIDTEIRYTPLWDATGKSCIQISVSRASVESMYQWVTERVEWGLVSGESTVSLLGHPTYVDCDLGEAYLIKDGAYISLNKYLDLGSDLPKLAVGENTFEMDNTITDLKVVPRWWKV